VIRSIGKNSLESIKLTARQRRAILSLNEPHPPASITILTCTIDPVEQNLALHEVACGREMSVASEAFALHQSTYDLPHGKGFFAKASIPATGDVLTSLDLSSFPL